VVEVDHVSVSFDLGDTVAEVVRDVTFRIDPGQRVGLVGESGSGKSMTARTIMQLLPPQGRVSAGHVVVDGETATTQNARKWRGTTIAMITQDPLSSLNPLVRIGVQITEMLTYHRHLRRGEARLRAIELLTAVGIPDPPRTMRQYPGVLSGGMRQRVALAIAISCNPRLLIADEPTTALDVTIQAQVLDLLETMSAEHESAVLLISHDLGVVANFCDTIIVMYAGRIVETSPTDTLIADPQHPYTRALLTSVPSLTDPVPDRLASIPGSPPATGVEILGCPFAPRCPLARDICRSVEPLLEDVRGDGRFVACHAASDPTWSRPEPDESQS
jgi:oligopeptide/dipeptide ABC transporter ATP-binding protein